MRHGIHALRAMLEGGTVREVLVSRHGDQWGLAIRLGGAGSRWLPERLRRRCSIRAASASASASRKARRFLLKRVLVKGCDYRESVGVPNPNMAGQWHPLRCKLQLIKQEPSL